ncbi:S41 family peptidase [Mesonia sp. MT50]|uniref:S41 family peptidase n=1 Tax=Mesonia profundi TaxID=3070998 RepID=A0ABU1A5G7_9FLAO|nr:S41 family peptidase [Mesonia profundi]MDQ7918056.1 S41 family peptidase [Mesonia profundi]
MFKKILFFILLSVVFVGCKNSKKEVKELTKADLNGFGEQQGEGEIIEINDSLVISYYSSNFNCYPNWKISRKYFNTQTPTITVNPDESFNNKEGYTVFTYTKLKEKPSLCKELTPKQKSSNTYNFETLWNTFNEQYAFFKERNVDWDAIKSKYRAKFTDKTEAFEFYLLMENMVLELNDEHSNFDVPDEFDEQWHRLQKKKGTTNYKQLVQNQLLHQYLKAPKKYNAGQLSWGLISNKISYIQLNGMDGLANYFSENDTTWDTYWEITENSDDYQKDLLEGTNKITDSIIKDIKNTKACILDLRFNGGGYDKVGLAFLSHFIDKEYTIFNKKRRFKNGYSESQTINIKPSENNYTKKVYVLTSPFTVSAAETSILASMNFPNFKRFGSNTNGAFSDIFI